MTGAQIEMVLTGDRYVFIFNYFLFNILIIIALKFFADLTQCCWRDKIALSRHMYCRDNISHVRRCLLRRKPCHATDKTEPLKNHNYSIRHWMKIYFIRKL
jgi:hypothetical protein